MFQEYSQYWYKRALEEVTMKKSNWDFSCLFEATEENPTETRIVKKIT